MLAECLTFQLGQFRGSAGSADGMGSSCRVPWRRTTYSRCSCEMARSEAASRAASANVFSSLAMLFTVSAAISRERGAEGDESEGKRDRPRRPGARGAMSYIGTDIRLALGGHGPSICLLQWGSTSKTGQDGPGQTSTEALRAARGHWWTFAGGRDKHRRIRGCNRQRDGERGMSGVLRRSTSAIARGDPQTLPQRTAIFSTGDGGSGGARCLVLYLPTHLPRHLIQQPPRPGPGFPTEKKRKKNL